ncbi:hypothetical protein [Paraburkholderia nemoris]|uniref:hypothetical protein n=1 Tax=Paraburkholderia nemoris TaxID=2793076 RepID=UPI001B2AD39B|nr:hypothetical protein [Paraburkholderia nemoris]CAE6839410.1 hypothetical protein R75777_06996 [Paraburkholderia nemoris]
MKEDIQKYLGTVAESTAKTISHKLGLPQLDVSRELNGMVKDGTLEREMKKGEYAYWLTRADVSASKDRGVDPSITITNHGPGMGAQAVLIDPQATTTAPTLRVSEPEVFDPPELREVDRPLSELYALIGVDPSITDIPVQHAIEMVRSLKAIGDACLEAKARQDDQITTLQAQVCDARNDAELQKDVIAKLRGNNAELERKIDELTIVDAEFVPSQVFVTIGRAAAPKRHKTLEKAQRRAQLLVRSEKESEVLVLEPVGRVVRGAEWRSQ